MPPARVGGPAEPLNGDPWTVTADRSRSISCRAGWTAGHGRGGVWSIISAKDAMPARLAAKVFPARVAGLDRWVLTIEHMTIQRMDHVGVVVDDLAAATEFFVDLGLELQGEGPVDGRWVDRIIGLGRPATAAAELLLAGLAAATGDTDDELADLRWRNQELEDQVDALRCDHLAAASQHIA